MNLGDVADSPWSDQRSHSPSQQPAPADLSVPGDASNGSSTNAANAANVETSTSDVRPAAVKAPGGRAGRTPRKAPAQATRLEAVAVAADPLLGPLGGGGGGGGDGDVFSSTGDDTSSDLPPPPALPQKQQQQSPAAAAALQNSRPYGGAGRPGSSHTPGFGRSGQGGDGFVPRSHAGPDGGSVQGGGGQPPMIGPELAPKATFNITVGDPHKVGDLTGSHMMYQVRTKTNSKAFRQVEFEVSRRYKDFLWLYGQLHSNNPGTVVPPPPEKQAMGRYEADFIESRRQALERMLNKTASHPNLQNDTDFKLFLESESFNVDVKARDKKDPDMPTESKGVFSGLNLSVGSGTKFIEHDDWFLERRVYLDTLEGQLKGLLKATDSAVAQRRSLAEASAELSTSLNALSQVELSAQLTGPLASLSDLYLRIRDLYARQAQQDVLTLSSVIDEYIRLIGSIKKAFEQRQRSWQGWHNAESDLQKRRAALDKLSRQGRSQQDRLAILQADVQDAERRAHQVRLTFEDLGRAMRAELERFEKEKVEDFRMGVETFLESAVEAQKELIELWETFLMHLDADEEEQQEAQRQLDGRYAGADAAATTSADQARQQPLGIAGLPSTAQNQQPALGDDDAMSRAPTAVGDDDEDGEAPRHGTAA